LTRQAMGRYKPPPMDGVRTREGPDSGADGRRMATREARQAPRIPREFSDDPGRGWCEAAAEEIQMPSLDSRGTATILTVPAAAARRAELISAYPLDGNGRLM
jgi:hypothetical protein